MSVPYFVMVKIRSDLRTSPDIERMINYGWNNEKIEAFLIWFQQKAKKLDISSNINTNPINCENIKIATCFGNAQYISIKYNLLYYEGFAYKNAELGDPGYFLHGFNMQDDRVKDFTFLCNKNNSKLPTEYYGILIPRKCIIKHNGPQLDTDIDDRDPLLFTVFDCV